MDPKYTSDTSTDTRCGLCARPRSHVAARGLGCVQTPCAPQTQVLTRHMAHNLGRQCVSEARCTSPAAKCFRLRAAAPVVVRRMGAVIMLVSQYTAGLTDPRGADACQVCTSAEAHRTAWARAHLGCLLARVHLQEAGARLCAGGAAVAAAAAQAQVQVQRAALAQPGRRQACLLGAGAPRVRQPLPCSPASSVIGRRRRLLPASQCPVHSSRTPRAPASPAVRGPLQRRTPGLRASRQQPARSASHSHAGCASVVPNGPPKATPFTTSN